MITSDFDISSYADDSTPYMSRGGSRAAATSKIECFVMIVNDWKLLTIITKHSILDVATALDPRLCVSVNNMEETVKSFEEPSTKLFKWFSDAYKCHLLVSTNNTVDIRLQNFDIKNSHCEKLLGIKFDHILTFNSPMSDLCRKASKTVHALTELFEKKE